MSISRFFVERAISDLADMIHDRFYHDVEDKIVEPDESIALGYQLPGRPKPVNSLDEPGVIKPATVVKNQKKLSKDINKPNFYFKK